MLKEEEGMELSLDVSADPIPPTPKNYNIISNIIHFNNILSISMCCGNTYLTGITIIADKSFEDFIDICRPSKCLPY